MQLRVGQVLGSAVDGTKLIVTKAPAGDVDVTCGGVPMVDGEPTNGGAGDPALNGGTLLGKRYVDDAGSIELLCTTAGDGSVALNGEVLVTAQAKALPSSD